MHSTIATGKIIKRRLEGMLPLDYFVYIPESGQRQDRVIVSIHGISRNAEAQVHGFSPQAEAWGTVMIAPLFPASSFPSYQRLGTSAHEQRADLAFDQILQDAWTWLNIVPRPLHAFGFSGGGQFLHRYAMFYPDRLARIVLGAPGWYTFPDPERQYPLGMRSGREWPHLRFTPPKFLKIPTMVMVGDEDDIRDEDLNTARRIEAFQGLNRVERGQRWINAMRALARAYNITGDFRFESIANASHAFESYLAYPQFGELVFSFLFDSPP